MLSKNKICPKVRFTYCFPAGSFLPVGESRVTWVELEKFLDLTGSMGLIGLEGEARNPALEKAL